MNVKWMAVVYGIVASFLLNLISGLGLPFTNATLPAIGTGLTGLIAGAVAGYFAYEGLSGGALHGFLATTIGAIIAGIFLIILGSFAWGLASGLGIAIGLVIYILLSGIPGAVGGAIGGMISPKEDVAGRPAT